MAYRLAESWIMLTVELYRMHLKAGEIINEQPSRKR